MIADPDARARGCPSLQAISWAVAVFLLLPAGVEARRGAPPLSQTHTVNPMAVVRRVQVDAVARQALLQEDEEAGPGPVRFARPTAVNLTPDTDGTWEVLPDGGRLWRLRVSAPGATDLNFGFREFHLPAGVTLHILGEESGYYQGPFGAGDNRPHRELWTPVIPGDAAVLEVYVPPAVAEPVSLVLSQVSAGYRDFFKLGAVAKQGSCNVDVACPEANAWRDEARSVARYTISGVWLCTGSLIMDAQSSYRSWFLTANHCGVSAANDHTVVVYWNFESPACGDLGGGSLDDNQAGATFRAARSDVDFCLLELIEAPASSFRVYYAGWDRSGIAPSATVGIHHPQGDEKSICFNDDAVTTANSCIGAGSATHWMVNDWELGTTEGGSSGSGLWDSATHRLVGFLSGGTAACANPSGSDCYGKLSVAWSGSDAGSRLSDWLDPEGSGVLTVDGSDPSGAAILLSKTVYAGHDNGALAPGYEIVYATNRAPITFCFVIANAGTEPLSGVIVSDPALGYVGNVGALAVGQSVTQLVQTLLQGSWVNTATASGSPPGGGSVSSVDAAQVIERPAPDTVWINEFHYDNSQTDQNEGVEIAGVAYTDLSRYSLVLYDGSSGLPYNTNNLSGSIDDEGSGYGAVWFGYPLNAVQNGAPDGIALVRDGAAVVQLLSYEGSFMAADGMAAGFPSEDVVASESSTTPTDFSLQLLGAGNASDEFAWANPRTQSRGLLNSGQTMAQKAGVRDSDGDGLNDLWEARHFGRATDAAAGDDVDEDGMSNAEEQVADTNPWDEDSRLYIASFSNLAGRVLVFPSSTSRVYRVEYTDHLGASPWLPLMEPMSGEQAKTTVIDPADVPSRIYRIEVSGP